MVTRRGVLGGLLAVLTAPLALFRRQPKSLPPLNHEVVAGRDSADDPKVALIIYYLEEEQRRIEEMWLAMVERAREMPPSPDRKGMPYFLMGRRGVRQISWAEESGEPSAEIIQKEDGRIQITFRPMSYYIALRN